VALPWDVYATPIEARKLARLGIERGEVVLRPAFYRQFGASYGTRARALCPIRDHDAPQIDCSCGFYAVAGDDELWRLGADDPDVAVLDVALAGRVIEHDNGWRASDQQARDIWLHGACVRCGRRAEVLHHRRFGALVPACRRCARRPISVETVAASLGVPVGFTSDAAPASRLARLTFVLAHLLVPVILLVATAALAAAWNSVAPLALGQLAIIAWLMAGASALRQCAGRLGIAPTEGVRLQHRWSPMVAVVAIGCDVVLAVVLIAIWNTTGP
jgi:hypothetical protein